MDISTFPTPDSEKADNVGFNTIVKNLLFENECEAETIKEEKIKVFLRIRPFLKDEIKKNDLEDCYLKTYGDNSILVNQDNVSMSKSSIVNKLPPLLPPLKYTFTKVFQENVSQKEFFDQTTFGMIRNFIDGQNCLIFTYGVTNSGKTYTMIGEPTDPGIMPRAMDIIFNSIAGRMYNKSNIKPDLHSDVVRVDERHVQEDSKFKETLLSSISSHDKDVASIASMRASDSNIQQQDTSDDDDKSDRESFEKEIATAMATRKREDALLQLNASSQMRYSVWVSMVEIYNDIPYDLLIPLPKKKGQLKRIPLKLKEDGHGLPYVKDLREIYVANADEAFKLLAIGKRNLQIATTSLNQVSSRSHCIFNVKLIKIEAKEEQLVAKISTLSLCDLAGSELNSKSGNIGERFREANNINNSLMILGRCIKSLRQNQMQPDPKKHIIIPFRESKLTKLFQNFLTGKGQASMIVQINKLKSMLAENLNAIKFSSVTNQIMMVPSQMSMKNVDRKLDNLDQPEIKKKRKTIEWADEKEIAASKIATANLLNMEDTKNFEETNNDDDEDENVDDDNDTPVDDSAHQRCFRRECDLQSQLDILKAKYSSLENELALSEIRIQKINELDIKHQKQMEERHNERMDDLAEYYEEMMQRRINYCLEDKQTQKQDFENKITELQEKITQLRSTTGQGPNQINNSLIKTRFDFKDEEKLMVQAGQINKILAINENDKHQFNKQLEDLEKVQNNKTLDEEDKIRRMEYEINCLKDQMLVLEKCNSDLKEKENVLKSVKKEFTCKIELLFSYVKDLSNRFSTKLSYIKTPRKEANTLDAISDFKKLYLSLDFILEIMSNMKQVYKTTNEEMAKKIDDLIKQNQELYDSECRLKIMLPSLRDIITLLKNQICQLQQVIIASNVEGSSILDCSVVDEEPMEIDDQVMQSCCNDLLNISVENINYIKVQRERIQLSLSQLNEISELPDLYSTDMEISEFINKLLDIYSNINLDKHSGNYKLIIDQLIYANKRLISEINSLNEKAELRSKNYSSFLNQLQFAGHKLFLAKNSSRDTATIETYKSDISHLVIKLSEVQNSESNYKTINEELRHKIKSFSVYEIENSKKIKSLNLVIDELESFKKSSQVQICELENCCETYKSQILNLENKLIEINFSTKSFNLENIEKLNSEKLELLDEYNKSKQLIINLENFNSQYQSKIANFENETSKMSYENSILKTENENNRTERIKLEKYIKILQNDIKELENDNLKYKTEIATLLESVNLSKQSIKNVENSNNNYQLKITNENSILKTENESFKIAHSIFENTIKILESKIKELENDNLQYKSKILSLGNDFSDIEHLHKQKEISSMKISNLELIIDKYKQKYADLELKNNRLEDEVNNLDLRNQSTQQQRKILENENILLKDEQTNHLHSKHEIDELNDKISSLIKSEIILRNENLLLNKSIIDLTNKIEDMEKMHQEKAQSDFENVFLENQAEDFRITRSSRKKIPKAASMNSDDNTACRGFQRRRSINKNTTTTLLDVDNLAEKPIEISKSKKKKVPTATLR